MSKPTEITMRPLERHELSNLFPEMSPHDFNELCDSMRDNGYLEQHPITTFQGQVLDGHHRQKAAFKIGVAPIYKQFAGSTRQAINYVNAANGARRHLTEAQKVAAAMKVSGYLQREMQAAERERERKRVVKQAGKRTSKTTVRRLEKVYEKDAEVFDKIISGEMSPAQAERTVDIEPESDSIAKADNSSACLYRLPPKYTILRETLGKAARMDGIKPTAYVRKVMNRHLQSRKDDVDQWARDVAARTAS